MNVRPPVAKVRAALAVLLAKHPGCGEERYFRRGGFVYAALGTKQPLVTTLIRYVGLTQATVERDVGCTAPPHKVRRAEDEAETTISVLSRTVTEGSTEGRTGRHSTIVCAENIDGLKRKRVDKRREAAGLA